MAKVMAIVGYAPGLSHQMAVSFGKKGFTLALVGKNMDKKLHEKQAEDFTEAGITATPFDCDLNKPPEITEVFAKIAADVGPISVLFWNTPCNSEAEDFMTVCPQKVKMDIGAGVAGLIAAVQAVVPGMEGKEGAAIYITGGGHALASTNADIPPLVTASGSHGVAATKAAQHNLAYTMADTLKSKNIKVFHLLVDGEVGHKPGTIKPAHVVDAFEKAHDDAECPVSTTISAAHAE